MHTDIGRAYRGRAGAALAIGVAAVAADLGLVWLNRYPESIDGRWAVGLVAFTALTWVAGGDLPTVGLAAPAGGWRRWVRLGVLIGLAVGAGLAAVFGVWVAAGWPVPVRTIAPAQAVPLFVHMCVFAPLLEEPVYRVALCAPLTAAAGPWRAIVASGVVFGALHVVYGNPSPENLLGGFVLAWAYLKSGSVCVPLVLHGAGNFFPFAGQLAAWYWFGG